MRLVFYTDRIIPERFAGLTIGFVVLIRPKYRDDSGLLAHELVHVRQFWRSCGLSMLLYEISKSWRLRYEVEAYKAQMACYPDNRAMIFAGFLSEKYRLDITQIQAWKLLTT